MKPEKKKRQTAQPPSPPDGWKKKDIPQNLHNYIRFHPQAVLAQLPDLEVQDRQIRQLREDCLRMHEMLRALIHRAYSVEREATSAERLLSRLHFRVEQRFGPGGNMLVPTRMPRPRRKRREKPRPW